MKLVTKYQISEELASLKHDLEKKRKEEEAKLKKEQEGMSTPGLDCMVVGFTTTCAISAYHQ
jgi:hypothetical protein